MSILKFLPSFLVCAVSLPLLAQEPETAVAVEEASSGQEGEAAEELAPVPVLRPKGSYADLPETGFDPTSLLTGGGGSPKPFFELLDRIDRLADNESNTVLVDLSESFALNLAQLREVERAMKRVRESGKKTVAYLENVSGIGVQVAALCDRVLMADMAALDFGSPAMNVMYLKDAMNLLGVQAEMTRVGEFKGAVEPYVLSEMSGPLRDHYLAMLETMNADIVRRVAEGRGLSPDVVRDIQAKRMFSAKAAKEAGLVDELVPWQGAEAAMRAELDVDSLEFKSTSEKKKRRNVDLFSALRQMFNRRDREEEIEDPELVVLHLSGGIADGTSAQPGSIVSGPAVEAINKLADNEFVKGVVVRINSPGGSATASEAVRLALEKLAEKKPVVFSMGNMAASGGYWITAIGRPILAEAGTVTGSIGVFSLRLQIGALMRRIGLHNEMVALDEGAAMNSMERPWSPAARERVQSFVDDIYDRFIAIVAESRDMPAETVRKLAGGRVWSGTQALEAGLIDQLGGVDEALAIIRGEADVDEDVEVRHYPNPQDFASSIMGQLFDARVLLAEEPKLAMLLRRSGTGSVLWTAVKDMLAGKSPMSVYAMLPADLVIR